METTQHTTEHLTEIDKETSFYLARIRQIDRILEGPVKTLIRLGVEGKEQGGQLKSPAEQPIYLPTWISESVEPEKRDFLLTQCLGCATLQRLWRLRRRFSWLDKASYKQLESLRGILVSSFTAKRRRDFSQSVELLNSETLGGLNPLTASQVFRVLMEAGEDHAHSGMGFLAFFAGVWPICRRFPEPLTIGARIEPWEVTAYVTAKCVLPIKVLQKVITLRARLLDSIRKNLTELNGRTKGRGRRTLWEFDILLDDLGANLSHLSSFSINRKAIEDCAEAVKAVHQSHATSSNQMIYESVLKDVGTALILVRDRSEEVLGEAREMVDNIKKQILKQLKIRWNPTRRLSKRTLDDSLKRLTGRPFRLKFSEEYLNHPGYWEDLYLAAKKALSYCQRTLEALETVRQICPKIKNKKHKSVKKGDSKERIRKTLDRIKIGDLRASVDKALGGLAQANRRAGEVLDESVKDAARWCRSVVDREIAHASAENLTDFDPSELVSAIAVAVAWNLISTTLQVSDAITKAIAGARKDGSWRSGKPFYSPNHAFGIWAGTSDIVWTLTSAIEQFRGVTGADEELFNYVNWLERTQITLIPGRPTTQTNPKGKPNQPKFQGASAQQPYRNYIGWSSERLRDRRKIHLGTTALSINALLEIRDLVEYRLWQLCKKRFSVVPIDKLLKELDPVDLGATHSKRLHRRLAGMVREAQGEDYKDAEYSLVLHGPPGSSKTKMAEALSAEMWKSSSRWGPREPRLIRITPADFTRLGEDRLDSEARVIFDLIGGVRAVTIFFDEIDDLLRQRNTSSEPPRFMDLVVPAMLNRLADLRSACPRQEICFLLATNYVENIDSALIRKGRIDDSIPVVYPDLESRTAIISNRVRKQAEEKVANFFDGARRCESLAQRTAGWPYSAIISSCDLVTKELERGWSNNLSENRVLFKGVLATTIADLKSSFSEPAYDTRWRYSQEMLNEYLHHIISRGESPADCKELLREQPDCSVIKKLVERLDEMLDSIIRKEGRWQV